MIITQTPFRMSFFGGGTDLEFFFKEYGGAVISTTFDKYCYVNVRYLPAFFDYKTELSYSVIERVTSNSEIQHPLIRNAMEYAGVNNIRLTYEADLPARSGLGSSSSFAVGLMQALYALQGKYADKKKLADDAIFVERNLCHEKGGLQDQIAASFGGFNRIDFNADGYSVSPIVMTNRKKQQLNKNLMLFFTGFSRFSAEIQEKNKLDDPNKIGKLKEMYALVDEAQKVLLSENDSLDEFGRLLDYTWSLKRDTGNAVTTSSIDLLYEKAKKAGALGGKLLGAGGGGFMLFYVPSEKQQYVRQVLNKQLYVPFSFENQGTKILYYSSED